MDGTAKWMEILVLYSYSLGVFGGEKTWVIVIFKW